MTSQSHLTSMKQWSNMLQSQLGRGHAALEKCSAIVGIPGMARGTYDRLATKVATAQTLVASEVLRASAEAVHNANETESEDGNNDDSVDGDQGGAEGEPEGDGDMDDSIDGGGDGESGGAGDNDTYSRK
jgi:hypothetical protein